MKFLSEKRALEKLHKLKSEYRETITDSYEHRAKSCLTCDTKGACCLDAHFVNVHITRLEAAAIRKTLSNLPGDRQAEAYRRVEDSIEKYDLTDEGDTFARTYACPLFEAGTGCLVHHEGKPLPCISHACYENKDDLPPDELQIGMESKVETLNRRAYGESIHWRPLPLWLRR
ncbi:MAG: hypothetical protein H7070_16265 [Saprospiraceae bacterium]|nr:hypothetical protein [Pyrinomonadaceae bacterium]